MTEYTSDSLDRRSLGEYLRILRRRWAVALAFVVLAVGASLAYSLTVTPGYVASADVLIEPSGTDSLTSGGSRIDAEEVATQTQVVSSLSVARLVQDRLSLPTIPDLTELVSVQPVGTSRILRITAEDTNPKTAKTTANTVAAAYLQFREQDSVGRYDQARARLSQEQVEAERRLEKIDSLLAKQPANAPALQSERRSLLANLGEISEQQKGLTDALTTAAAGGELVRAAKVPTDPISPKPVLNTVLGGLVGLVLGVGVALLRDRFDDVVHDAETVQRALGSVLLAKVPQWSERAHRDRLVTLQDPHAAASEEFQRLGVNVRFMLATKSRDTGAVVLLTSAEAGEGKTVTSCNVAVALARLGLRVVIIDADLRRASVAGRFGLGDPPGLADLLVSDEEAASFLIGVGTENLSVLPAGTLPPNPAALLGSPRMREVLASMRTVADMVIVDSPPALVGADGLELINIADMVVVVARDRVSYRHHLLAVRDVLKQASVDTVGAVYNAVSDNAAASYRYTDRRRTTAPQGEPEPLTNLSDS